MTAETFRTAYQQAYAELRQISEQYDKLNRKKQQVEKIVEVLRPLLEMKSSESAAAARPVSDPSMYLVEETVAAAEPSMKHLEAMEPEFEPVPMQPMEAPANFEPSSDPFQRRIESVLWGWSQKREGVVPAV
ncbi:MAG TPA: hypothetical protein VKR52_05015 [Terracidiphilus sp.]|nr:hypothetical protein [Terracidiphilus sp.]